MRYDGREWTRFGVEYGLMDAPSKLIVTRNGALWATGSHEHVAATARLDGSKWILKRPGFHGVLIRVLFTKRSTVLCGSPRPWIGGYMMITTFSVGWWHSMERTGHITPIRV